MISTRKRPLLLGAPFIPTLSHLIPPLLSGSVSSPDMIQDSTGADINALVQGNTTFALDLYAELRGRVEGNMLVSPYSVSQALAMTYAGAHDETAAQMADVLSFTLSEPGLHAAFAALTADLVARGNAPANADAAESRSFRNANALWVEQTYPILPAYTDDLTKYYGSALNQADFQNAPDETREEINAWVEEQTEDRIQDIVGKNDITSSTVMVLANAIYFYGAWQSAFDPDDTSDGPFYFLDGTTVDVPLMYQHAELRYTWGDGYQAIEFPYAESGFALMVLLPDEGRFEAVESRLDVDMLAATVDHLETIEAGVYLPKFQFTFGTIELTDTLKALGMVAAFDPEQLDFLDVSPSGLVLNRVLHKAFIGVDERGTEAAAATIVIASPGAAPPIIVNRPFLFAIRDTVTGTVLFLGRVMDPSG